VDELKDPYLDEPRERQELTDLVREIMLEWPQTHGYYILNGKADPEEFGLPAVEPHEGWSTIFPKKRILYITGMRLWAEPAIYALISHEIGHIVGEHNGGESEIELENHLDEYYADEFAFENVKQKYGFVPQTAGLWLLQSYVDWRWDIDSLTHPANVNRWERLSLNGYVPRDYHQQLQALGLETEGDRYASLRPD